MVTVKVKAYPTLQDAEPELMQFYYQNAILLTGIMNQSIAMVETARQTMTTKTPEKEINLLIDQLSRSICQVGIGQEITLLGKLYNCSKGYTLEINYIEDDADTIEGYFKTIEELVEACRRQVQEAFPTHFGAKVSPFFYTILEPLHLSDQERQLAKELLGYRSMTCEQQRDFNITLEAYVEYGLGKEERQEFERSYARFFN